MDYIQLLFSFFNAPLFATFIIGMFWKRMTPWAGFYGLLAGTLGAALAHYGNEWGWFDLGSAQAAAFWGAIAAFVLDAIVSVAVTLRHEAQAGRGARRASSTAWPSSTSDGPASERRLVPEAADARARRARPDRRSVSILFA